MYVPVGDAEETIAIYEERCALLQGAPITTSAAKWYCDMATHLRSLSTAPPPKPPPFVALNPLPGDVADGTAHEQFWRDKAAKEARNKKLMLLAAAGLGAYLVLAR
jgi:hypothetical protein